MRPFQGPEPGQRGATELSVFDAAATATETSTAVHQHPYVDTDDHRYASHVEVHQEHALGNWADGYRGLKEMRDNGRVTINIRSRLKEG